MLPSRFLVKIRFCISNPLQFGEQEALLGPELNVNVNQLQSPYPSGGGGERCLVEQPRKDVFLPPAPRSAPPSQLYDSQGSKGKGQLALTQNGGQRSARQRLRGVSLL